MCSSAGLLTCLCDAALLTCLYNAETLHLYIHGLGLDVENFDAHDKQPVRSSSTYASTRSNVRWSSALMVLQVQPTSADCLHAIHYLQRFEKLKAEYFRLHTSAHAVGDLQTSCSTAF